jgi:YfiH family protein
MSHPPSRRADVLCAPGVAHGFFGRQGGVSTGLYASLNTGLGSRDDPAAVRENRRRIAAALGVGPHRLITNYQVHSASAVTVRSHPVDRAAQADGLATDEPGLALGVLAADCGALLLLDPDARVIGAAHAGWKGALAGVIEATVTAMESLGAAAGRMRVATGPCIAQASYEVGPEFLARFEAEDPDSAAFFRGGPGDRAYFDLEGYCVRRLARAGVGRVERLSLDTCARADAYFSNRRAFKAGEPDFGRNMSAITLLGGAQPA